MIPPILVTPPASSDPVVTLAEAKAHLRELDSFEDTLISSAVAAAVSYLDGWRGKLGRCIVNQTWQQDFAAWSDPLRLPFPDVSAVTLKYFDTDAAEQTVLAAEYEVIETACGAEIAFKDAFTRPSLDGDRRYPVFAELVAGYGAAVDVPEDLKQIVKFLMALWVENREAALVGLSVAELPFSVRSLIENYRRVGV